MDRNVRHIHNDKTLIALKRVRCGCINSVWAIPYKGPTHIADQTISLKKQVCFAKNRRKILQEDEKNTLER